jgi:CubicO group peptidase (beta-lactamase class C family)
VHPADWPGPDLAAFLDRLLSKHSKLGFEPGAKASYSNLGFLVLGQIIEATSGRSVQDYVRQEILGPLGMHHTDYAYPTSAAPVATGYQRRRSPMAPLMRWRLPAGILGPQEDGYLSFRASTWTAQPTVALSVRLRMRPGSSRCTSAMETWVAPES